MERHSSHLADLMYFLADIFLTELCRVEALRGGRLAVDHLGLSHISALKALALLCQLAISLLLLLHRDLVVLME